MKNNSHIHWSEEKEAVSGNVGLKFLFFLLTHIPVRLVLLIVFPVSFIFFTCSKDVRRSIVLYQRKLKQFTSNKVPKRYNIYAQFFSFSLCIVEKMLGWIGRINYNKIIKHKDDITTLIDLLNNNHGAVLLVSHLGNIDLLRSLTSFNETGVRHPINVYVIAETNTTKHFNKSMAKINPNVEVNIVNDANISIDTICFLQEKLDSGALVVYAADRTAPQNKERVIKEKFLGTTASFPYGAFLLTSLLNSPSFFAFGLRTKTFANNPIYNMFVEKVTTPFNCPRDKREDILHSLCREYISKLEKYCLLFPYQWYNFFNFWQ